MRRFLRYVATELGPPLLVLTIFALIWLAQACQRFEPLTGKDETANLERQASAPLPNVVIILTDDQRWELVPFMNHVTSQLVDSGVSFARAYNNSPLCCPSRASLLTGWMQHTTKVRGNSPPFGGAKVFKDAQTLAVDLKAAGYTTALIGKYLNGYGQQLPANYVPPGWSEWRAYRDVEYTNAVLVEKAWDSSAVHTNTYSGYSPSVLRNRVVSFLQDAPAAKPVFLMFTPYAPHRQVNPDGYPLPASADVGKCAGVTMPGWSPARNEADVSDKPNYVRTAPTLTALQLAQADTGRRKQCEALYVVDRTVGDIISTLQATGRLANTLLVFMTDNGYLFGEHRLTERKASMYEEAIRTPLVIRGLGARLGAIDSNFVQTIDITATVRALANLTPNGSGRNLLPTLASGTYTTDALLIEMDNATEPYESFSAVRMGDFAYAEYPKGSLSHGAFTELYDLAVDPAQLVNVASSPAYQSTVTAMHAKLLYLKSQP